MLFHHNAKTKVVEGGHGFIDLCPECGRRARFVEVEVITSFGVFFVDLVDDKERKYRCTACAEVFDLREEPERATPATSAREIAAARAAAGAARASAEAARAVEVEHRRELAEARANRIEDELAELKKRLGR